MTQVNSSLEDIYPKGKTIIREVGLRDGLQLVKSFPTTEAKKAWIDIDYRAGLRHFEIGSYLPAKAFPQFQDTESLIRKISSLNDARSSALVLNKRGAINGLLGNADELTCVISASEEHNLRNAKRSRKDSLREISEIISLRADSDSKPLISVGIAMAFGCSIQGKIDIKEVVNMAERSVHMGADLIGIADTVGYGGPKQVKELISALRSAIGDTQLLMHFHNTRGLGLSNVAAALDMGVNVFDASLSGLGGCLFAPKATGNIVLEDVAFLCETMGFPTGIDINTLLPARKILQEQMPEEILYGALARAGLPNTDYE
ncbi:MAG: hydroxymethylglutaryl-CoA lyase [Robiginitomaculum sp.]|nr:MAG: hydroxymethylglutaryl-CoA lyase [Robiginitomaculum sp.]